jgi:hypothetical protein
MNPRERLLSAIRGESIDRVPLMLDGFVATEKSTVDAINDPLQHDIASRVFDNTCGFIEHPSHVNRYLVTPNQYMSDESTVADDGVVTTTTRIETPRGPLTAITQVPQSTRTMWTVKYPVESMEDIEKIRSVEWEMPAGLKPADYSDLTPEVRDRAITRAGVSSPFVCAAGMMSYQWFLELCATDFALVKELTEICADRIEQILDVLFAGDHIDYLWIGGSEWLTPPMGSPKLYDELVQEYERRIIDRAHEHGTLVHVHCHGNVRSTLEQVVERGADFFEPMEPPPDGDITMQEAKLNAAGRMTLGGNLEARVIENEDVSTTETAARAAFEGGKHRMVLKPSEGLSRPDVTPRMHANYHRFIDVWEELSEI